MSCSYDALGKFGEHSDTRVVFGCIPRVTRILLTVCALRDPSVPRTSEFDDAYINIMLHDISRRDEDHRKAIYKVVGTESERCKIKWRWAEA